MKKLLPYLILALLAVSAPSCKKSKQAGGGNNTSNDNSEPDQLRPQLDTRFQEKFFEAQKFKAKGEVEKAYKSFQECLQFEPNEPSVHYELARIDKYILLNSTSAQSHIKKCIEANPKNAWYQRLQAELYMDMGKYDLAAKTFEIVYNLNPDDQNALYDQANAHVAAGQLEKAAEVYDVIEKNSGVYEELSFQKHQIYMELDDKEKAAKELEKLAEANPSEARYWGLVAQFYQTIGEKEKSKIALDKMVIADPENGQVHYQLSEYYAAAGDDKKSFDELKKAFQTTDVTIDQKIAVLMRFYQASEMNASLIPEAYELIDITVAVHPKEAKAHSIQGDFYYRDRNDEKALSSFKKAISLDETKLLLWEQTLSLEMELDKSKDLIKDGERALELFPNSPLLYLYTGFGYEKELQYENAIEKWNMGKELVIENPSLLAQFYTSLGAGYHKVKNYTKSDEVFEKALIINPIDPLVLNNYAYYLSIRKTKLEKAVQLSKQANDIQPNVPTFQDTYAWALFQSGRFDEALIWIERAVGNDTKPNGELLEHYGDILYKTGRTKEALEQWKKAAALGGASEKINTKISSQKID